MILVTGATGHFGSSTAEYLQKKGVPFRAAAKHLEKLQSQFGSQADIIPFDWDRPETFARLFDDINTVSLMPPPVVTSDFHLRAKPFIEMAGKTGVKHIVLTTALYSDNPDSIFYGTEMLLKGAGLDFTIIRPSFLFQNFLNQFLQSVQQGVILAPSERGKTSYVDLRNVGEATAHILENPSMHIGKTYSITGNEALTHDDMAAIFSEQLSRHIIHISPSCEQFKKALAERGVPQFLFEFLATLYDTIAKGQWEKISHDYTLLTGKNPLSFRNFVKENRSIFLNTSGQENSGDAL